MSTPPKDTLSLRNAQEAWGDPLPDWVEALALAADQTSQSQAGKAIGYSGSTVNAVLKHSYNGDLSSVEKAVRGRWMAATVMCPVLGEMASNLCLDNQKRAVNFSASSSLRVRLVLLQALKAQRGNSAADGVLQHEAAAYGHNRTREVIRTELRFLADLGAVRLDVTGEAMVAVLLERGGDHLARKIELEGVLVPPVKA